MSKSNLKTPKRSEERIVGGAGVYSSISSSIFAETDLVAAIGNDFPKNMHGIWSSDCVSEKQVFIISRNTNMWIDESYVGFNISKTSEVSDWIAYKWGEIDSSYYYFLKNDGDKLFEISAPDSWDGIDYTFLNDSEYSIYEKCDSIPSMYQLIYGEIINLMNSQLIETCNNDKNPANCINETFTLIWFLKKRK